MKTSDQAFDYLYIISIVYSLVALIYVLRNWRQRLLDIESRQDCYRLACNSSHVRRIYAFGVAIPFIILALFGAHAYIFAVLIDKEFLKFYTVPFMAYFVLVVLISGPFFILHSLVAHVKINERGIGIESIGAKWIPFISWFSRWTLVQRIDVQYDVSYSSGIKRVVVRLEYGRHHSRVVIAGDHPEINKIIDNLRSFAPDKFDNSI
ncbi:MAG: hypothetical protein ACYC1M_09650 [Armatimonadota bacterium]